MYKPSEEVLEYSGHQPLKCGGCIAIPLLHYSALKHAEYCRECCFSNILWSYVCLLISLSVISNLDLNLAHTISWRIASWYEKGVTSFHIFSFCCRRLNTVLNVPIFFGIHSIGVACFAAAGTHHPAVVYRLIFWVSSEWNASGHFVLEPGQRLWCLKLKHYNLDRPWELREAMRISNLAAA